MSATITYTNSNTVAEKQSHLEAKQEENTVNVKFFLVTVFE